MNKLACLSLFLLLPACVGSDEALPTPHSPGDPLAGKADFYAASHTIETHRAYQLDPGFTLFSTSRAQAPSVTVGVGQAAAHAWQWDGTWSYVGLLSGEEFVLETAGSVYLAMMPTGAYASVAVGYPRKDLFERVLISEFGQLAELGMYGVDAASQGYLEGWYEFAATDLDVWNLHLAFEPVKYAPKSKAIVTEEGLVLRSIGVFSKTVASKDSEDSDAMCSIVYAVNEESFGQGAPGGRDGMCGQIATLNSLVQLGVWTEAETNDGGQLDEDLINRLDGYRDRHPVGMTPREVAEAHRGEVRKRTGRDMHCEGMFDADLGDPTEIGNLTKYLDERVNDNDNDWDCTLFFAAAGGFRHAENIETFDYDRASGAGVASTHNGLNQGTGNGDIPADPGNNEWFFNPDPPPSTPNCGLSSTPRESDHDNLGWISVGTAHAVCCRL